MAYRDVEVTPPAQPPLNWRPAAGVAIRVLLGLMVVIIVVGFTKIVAAVVADQLRCSELAAGSRAARAAQCARGGGTWSEGTVNGQPAEWCAGVRR